MRAEDKLIPLKKWLIDLRMKQEEIAKACGVSQALVSLTISGRRRNKRVIEFFLARGCPEDYLE
jgi:predicted transcriptional regulator